VVEEKKCLEHETVEVQKLIGDYSFLRPITAQFMFHSIFLIKYYLFIIITTTAVFYYTPILDLYNL